MLVTDVKIKLVPRSDTKLLAFASIVIDRCFLVRDIKIIGAPTAPFVAMPSRKITDHCKNCGCKNHLHALFCNQCGGRLPEKRARADDRGRTKLHADIIHPINAKCRRELQDAILKGYHEELERSRSPRYVPPKFSDEDDPEGDDFRTPSSGTAPAVSMAEPSDDGANPGNVRSAQSNTPDAEPPQAK